MLFWSDIPSIVLVSCFQSTRTKFGEVCRCTSLEKEPLGYRGLMRIVKSRSAIEYPIWINIRRLRFVIGIEYLVTVVPGRQTRCGCPTLDLGPERTGSIAIGDNFFSVCDLRQSSQHSLTFVLVSDPNQKPESGPHTSFRTLKSTHPPLDRKNTHSLTLIKTIAI